MTTSGVLFNMNFMGRKLGAPRGLLLSLIAVSLSVLFLGVESDANPVVRVVRNGDCLSELAAEFDVTVDEIRRWNRLDGDVIQVGQRLIVGYRGSKSSSKSRTKSRREKAPATTTYKVAKGDTLSDVAVRFGVDVEEILALNSGLRADHIEVGHPLKVPRARRKLSFHSVRRGDNLSRIASRYGVDVEDLVRWNRGLRATSLRIGSRLKVYPSKAPSSKSLGRPWDGSLAHGRRLQRHPLFVIRTPSRSWGTEETVQWIHDAFDAVRRRHKRAPRVRVHDLSFRNGGRIDGHRSHQNGRDADLIYFQRRCGRGGCQMRSVEPRNLLVGPQWTLMRYWLQRGQAQVIFVDYDLQAVLYRHAQKRGATRSQLRNWFQYPRGRKAAGGVIRHYANHRNHLHIRFRCPRGDSECVN